MTLLWVGGGKDRRQSTLLVHIIQAGVYWKQDGNNHQVYDRSRLRLFLFSFLSFLLGRWAASFVCRSARPCFFYTFHIFWQAGGYLPLFYLLIIHFFFVVYLFLGLVTVDDDDIYCDDGDENERQNACTLCTLVMRQRKLNTTNLWYQNCCFVCIFMVV